MGRRQQDVNNAIEDKQEDTSKKRKDEDKEEGKRTRTPVTEKDDVPQLVDIVDEIFQKVDSGDSEAQPGMLEGCRGRA